MYVKMDEDEVISMLVNRVYNWTDNEDVVSLFEKMYENSVYGGVFDGAELDVMAIVDNDYVNWCNVIRKGDDYFDELLTVYEKNGLGDCSCELNFCGFIEAVDDEDEPTMFLVRS